LVGPVVQYPSLTTISPHSTTPIAQTRSYTIINAHVKTVNISYAKRLKSSSTTCNYFHILKVSVHDHSHSDVVRTYIHLLYVLKHCFYVM